MKLRMLYRFASVQLAGSKRMSAFGVRTLMSVVQIASQLRLDSEHSQEKVDEMACIVNAVRSINQRESVCVCKGQRDRKRERERERERNEKR